MESDNVRIPAENFFGAEGQGFAQVMQGVGAAQSTLDETWKYATEREAFDQSISKFQGRPSRLRRRSPTSPTRRPGSPPDRCSRCPVA